MNTIKLAKAFVAVAVAFATTISMAKTKTVVVDGEELESGDSLTFDLDEEAMPTTINGAEVLSELFPSGIPVEWNGKKFKTPKATSPKIKKVDGDYELVIKEKGEENPCSLKISYKKKKGTVSGSFKVYTLTVNSKGKPKLKSYKASFSGRMGVDEGLKVTIKGGRSCTASLQ